MNWICLTSIFAFKIVIVRLELEIISVETVLNLVLVSVILVCTIAVPCAIAHFY